MNSDRIRDLTNSLKSRKEYVRATKRRIWDNYLREHIINIPIEERIKKNFSGGQNQQKSYQKLSTKSLTATIGEAQQTLSVFDEYSIEIRVLPFIGSITIHRHLS